MKVVHVDVETTGLDPKRHAIVEVAAILELDGQVTGDFHAFMRPHPGAAVESDALAINELTAPEIQAFEHSDKVWLAFTSWLNRHINPYDKQDKAFFVAYNATFDAEFIRQWFLLHGSSYFGSYFWTPPICTSVLAAHWLMDKRNEIGSFKLAHVAQFMGIEVKEDQLHGALYDVALSQRIFHLIPGAKQVRA